MSNVLRGTVVNPDVIRGKSAYEIAVMNGFDGTKEEWLNSLKPGVYYTVTIPAAADADLSPWAEEDSGGYALVKANKNYTNENFILHQCSDNTVYTNHELKVTVGEAETTFHVSSFPENACVLYLLVFNAYNGGDL